VFEEIEARQVEVELGAGGRNAVTAPVLVFLARTVIRRHCFLYALLNSHREGFGVARITPAPKSLLRGRVTIIAVIHSNLHFTYVCLRMLHSASWRRAAVSIHCVT